jgi:DNA-binding transcriptional MerR regulator
VSGSGNNRDYLRAGELARLTGVSADTLRHYERKGLIQRPRRSRNGYREYPFVALERVRLIRSALSVGFTIDELARILKERDKGGAPCRKVRELAQAKLEEAEQQLSRITALRDELRVLLQEWDGALESGETGNRARLLESLALRNPETNPGQSPLVRLPKNRTRRKREIDR